MAIKRTKAYPLDSRQKVVRLARSGLLPKILQLDLDSGRPAILRSATAMSATPTFASFVCSGLTPGISRNARMIGLQIDPKRELSQEYLDEVTRGRAVIYIQIVPTV